MHWNKSTLSQAVVCLSLLVMTASASAEEVVSIKVGHARALTLDGPPTTVAVGDGDVASASVALDNTLLLIGKRPGRTNVVALDADGVEMTNTVVQVVRADGRRTISVIRAGQPLAYVCGTEPGCLPVDPGSQVVDHAETNEPARGVTGDVGAGEAQVSTAPAAQNVN